MRYTDEEYAYWLNTEEEETYINHKVKGSLRFPSHEDNQEYYEED